MSTSTEAAQDAGSEPTDRRRRAWLAASVRSSSARAVDVVEHAARQAALGDASEVVDRGGSCAGGVRSGRSRWRLKRTTDRRVS